MRTAAYIPLHYGKDYLPYAINSVISEVEKIYILSSSEGSHGHKSKMICPETKQQLIECIPSEFVDKIEWIDGNWTQENQQRNYAHELARTKGYEILVAVDADEVWKPELLKELIQLTYERKANKCLVWMRHLWRSFNLICDDQMRQERIYYLGADANDLIYAPQATNQVWHFGYAIRPELMEYKISIHGHKAEWKNPNWYQQTFMEWPVGDGWVHPVCENVWYPKHFDKKELPEFMCVHPFY